MFRRDPFGLRVDFCGVGPEDLRQLRDDGVVDTLVDAAPGFRVGIRHIDRKSEGVFPMGVAAMNHFTVLSDDLEATRRFYCDLFGFKVGWRPPFQFPGWWFYADDDTPILHVIHRDPLPKERAGVLDHMAFSAKDLPGTVATLKREGIGYELRRLPGGGIWQLFFNDPHGAKVEFDFDKDEPAPEGHVGA